MHSERIWFVVSALVAVAVAMANPRASIAAGTSAPVTVKWATQAIVTVSLTPNYFTGFGQVPAKIGAQPTPTHGPNAGPGVGQGDVDFGDVLAGDNYLYKYAVHLGVNSTDTNGVNVYGEGAANFVNRTDSTSVPISSAVYWLSSTSGSPADANTGFSASVPFQKTNGAVTGGGYNVPTSIAYTVYPAPISSSFASSNADFYYDYQLHVPPNASQGDYFVWVVYTVLGR